MMTRSYIKECAELPLQYLPGASVLNKEVMNLMIMMTMLATKSAIADVVYMPHDVVDDDDVDDDTWVGI